MNKAVIIGGGLSGLTCALVLNQQGFEVIVIEKKQYPFHRVCGEYISNEVLPFLLSLNLNIQDLEPSALTRLAISSVGGRTACASLDSGGFGISRYTFDHYLYQKAVQAGIIFIFNKANDILFDGHEFEVELADHTKVNTRILIGAYGKRSNLDQKLKRSFFYNRSPYMGVKYHIRTDFPDDLVQLDNFEGGYCGICKIENGVYNLCYLTETGNLKKHGSISEMEKQILFKNAHLKYLFTNSEFLFNKPEVINEITFERKSLTDNHILFCGDAAGMITPLCGNGMAMAIHSGKILAETIAEHIRSDQALLKRESLEKTYRYKWEKQFSMRLRTGRFIQKLFGNNILSNLAVSALRSAPALTQLLVKKTHGKPF
jgi:menaquinone-9 beta-reductase